MPNFREAGSFGGVVSGGEDHCSESFKEQGRSLMWKVWRVVVTHTGGGYGDPYVGSSIQ